MPFLIILGAVAVLVIDYLIATQFYEVAVMKGHSKKRYLWLSFFFGIIGYLLVVALPDRKAAAANPPVYATSTPASVNTKPVKKVNDSLPEL